MGNNRPVGSMLALLLAAGCMQGADVSVDQTGGTVVATASRGSKPACVDDLDVTEMRDGTGEFGPVVWRIVTDDVDLCVSRFTLGVVPRGFDEEAPLAPLVPGRRYRVGVSGTGFMGTQFFTVVGTGASAPAGSSQRR